jgi:hypothetical protein
MKNPARFWFNSLRSLPPATATGTMLGMLTPLLVMLPSCSTPEPQVATTASYGPGYPAGSAGWTEKERALYRAAFDAGRRDQREGYRFDDDRVTARLDVDLKSFSRQGYRAGYYYDASRRRAARTAAGSDSSDPIPGGPIERPYSDSRSGLPMPSSSGTVAPAAAQPAPRPPAKRQGGDPFAVPLEGEPAPDAPAY